MGAPSAQPDAGQRGCRESTPRASLTRAARRGDGEGQGEGRLECPHRVTVLHRGQGGAWGTMDQKNGGVGDRNSGLSDLVK